MVLILLFKTPLPGGQAAAGTQVCKLSVLSLRRPHVCSWRGPGALLKETTLLVPCCEMLVSAPVPALALSSAVV